MESFLGDRSCLLFAGKGEIAVSIRHLAGGDVCISTVLDWLLSGVLLSAALVDGTGELSRMCLNRQWHFLGRRHCLRDKSWHFQFTSVTVFRSVLGSFLLLGDRPPAFTLLGEFRTHPALFRCKWWIKLFPQKRCFFNIRQRILDGGRWRILWKLQLFYSRVALTTQGPWMHIIMKFQKIWSDVPTQCYVRLRIFCVRLPFSGTLTTNSTMCMQSVQVHFFCMLTTLVSLHDETGEVNLSPSEEHKTLFHQ